MLARLCLVIIALGLTSCAGRKLKVEKETEQVLKEEVEFKERVTIKPIEKPVTKRPTSKKPVRKVLVRQPELEDSEGFEGRRPIKDPFNVGEKVVLDLRYLNMAAGQLTLETKPFAEVNKRKSYHFFISVHTSKFFSRIYEVDNSADTYLDFDEMVPHTAEVHVKESKTVRESKSFFDFTKNRARFWENKVTKKGLKEKQKSWDIQPYSQNVISIMFYLRSFTMKPGKVIKIPVADGGKNILLTAKVVRAERIKTKAGEFDTLVVKPEISIDGTFKPVGDMHFWFTNDERKFVVKLESSLTFGTIRGEASAVIK